MPKKEITKTDLDKVSGGSRWREVYPELLDVPCLGCGTVDDVCNTDKGPYCAECYRKLWER